MPSRLILIAHAETPAMRAGAFAADEGIAADAVPSRAGGPRHDRALAGPAKAAIETAAALGLDASVDDALRWLDVGRWLGRTLTDIAATDAAGAAAFVADPAFAGHGGESIAAFVARVRCWLDTTRLAGGSVLAVAPPALLRGAFVAAIGASAGAFWRLDVKPLDALVLGTDGRRWALRAFQPLDSLEP